MIELNKIHNLDARVLLGELGSESVHLIVTSPPYPGVCNMWGDLFKPERFREAHEFLSEVWDGCLNALKPGCKLIINIANTKRRPYLPNTHKIYEWAERKCEPLGEIIWNKGYGPTGTAWGSFRSPSDPSLADQHEYILVFRKYGERERPAEFEKIGLRDFKSWRNSVWNIVPAKASEVGHTAPFPEEIPKRLIMLYSFAGEIVCDPFAGSGTTCRVAEKLGRRWVGADIKPEYVDLAHKYIEACRAQGALAL